MISDVAAWLYTSILSLFQGILTWGILGFGIVSVHVLGRIINFIKRFFK